MRERSIVLSYDYLRREMSAPKNTMSDDGTHAYMNYSTFEEQFLKQTQGSNSKRSARRRVAKTRNHRYSDIESDTGSDGLAVNSSGSGRSGDWAPPRRRVKPRTKKRCDSSSLTDSGISLSKDSTSLSGSSCQRFEDDIILQNGETQNAQRCYDTTSSTPSNKGVTCSRRCSLRRSSSCSALPSNVKVLDRHNPRLSSNDTTIDNNERKISAEEQENAILQQCYKNEEELLSTTEYSNHSGRSYIFDCSKPLALSKFPLPEHLNYPLCKYRYKSDSILNRSPVKPLKKLKDGWKKLKARKASQQEKISEVDVSTISSNISYLEYLSEDEEDSESILARLGSNPTHKKSIIKKLFNKVGSKSYSTQATPSTVNELDSTPSKSMFQRAASTRSIPEALKDMWSKVHDVECYVEEPPITTLSRAKSMPSISCASNSQTELPGNVMYFNEVGLTKQQEQFNYFSNFFKPIGSPTKTPQSAFKPKLSGGNDVITCVLGQSNRQEVTQAKQTLLDAKLTSGTDRLTDKENIENKQPIDIDQDSTLAKENMKEQKDYKSFKPYIACNPESTHEHLQNPRKISQHSMYASSFDISPPKSLFYNPQAVYSPHMPRLPQTSMPQVNYKHCSCCMQHPTQYGYPYYPQPNFVYEVPPQMYSQTMQHGSRNNRDSVVIAPLDVQMSCERKAERRKISDMVFDTFV